MSFFRGTGFWLGFGGGLTAGLEARGRRPCTSRRRAGWAGWAGFGGANFRNDSKLSCDDEESETQSFCSTYDFSGLVTELAEADLATCTSV